MLVGNIIKKTLAVFFCLIALSGCNVGCQVVSVVSSGLAGGIANALSCTNVSAIQADVQTILKGTNLCKVEEDLNGKKFGTIANIFCPIIASTAVAYLGTQIPASWGCNPSSASATVATVVTQACELLPF